MKDSSCFKITYGTSSGYSTIFVLANTFDEALVVYEKIYPEGNKEFFGYQTSKTHLISNENIGICYYE